MSLIPRELIGTLNLGERDKELAAAMHDINWRDPGDDGKKYLFASEVVRQATDLVELVDPTPLMLQSRSYDIATTAIKLRDTVGYEAKTVTSGGYKETIRIDNEITTYPVPRRYDHVTIEVLKEDLEVGTYEDIAAMREGIAEAILRKKINAVWAACNDAIISGATPPGSDYTAGLLSGVGNMNSFLVASSTMDENSLNNAIDQVDAQGGGVFSIIGHPQKVNQIVKMTGFVSIMPEQAKLDYWRTGFLGIYRGARIVKLPAVVDKKYGIAPTDRKNVFVLGAGLGEIATFRGLTPATWSDDSRDIQYISAQTKYAVFTYQPKGACRITFSS